MIKYRIATPADNNGLVALASSLDMTGETGLRIDRKPDFFKLNQLRGKTVVFVAVDDDTIIGCLSVSFQEVYVGGKLFPLQYVGDLKVSPGHRNRGIGLQLCNELADYVVPRGADLAFLNVSKGNTKPFSFFKGRPNVPDFENIGIFQVHQFMGRRKQVTQSDQKIERASVTEELINFLDNHYRGYELGPVIKSEQLQACDIFIIRRNGKIVAAMCLIDTMEMKQNVVTKISWQMKMAVNCINMLSPILGVSKMPTTNKPVKMLYIRYLAVLNNETILARSLVNYARSIVFQKGYSFVSIGLHEKDQLHRCFSGIQKITFNSVGMLLTIKNNRMLTRQVKQGVPFEDYAMV